MAFFKRKEPMLGIDISPSSVKVVELSRSGSRFRVEACAIEALGDGMMEDRNPADPDLIGEAIKRACRRAGTRTRKAAVAVPTSSVISRVIPMPAEFKENDVEANIPMEAANYIPYPIEEIYLDFQMQGPSKNRGDQQQDVLLVATRKENVDTREAALKEAGLIPTVMDVECYALENTFRLLRDSLPSSSSEDSADGVSLAKARGSLTALVDIGATITSFYIFQEDQIVFSREQNFGCDLLTTRIADMYQLSREQAEKMKRSNQGADDYAETLLDPFKQMLVEQVGHMLQFFFSSDQFVSGRYAVDNMLLIGGGATLPGLERMMADILGITTIVANPFKNMGSASRVSSSNLLRDAPLLAVAGGLALRSFDA